MPDLTVQRVLKIGVLIGILLLMIGCGGYAFVRYYYVPMQEANRIVEELRSESRDEFHFGLLAIRGFERKTGEMVRVEGHRPLRGAAARKVHRALFEVMERTEDYGRLVSLFLTVSWWQQVTPGIHEFSEQDWAILAAACERHNAQTGLYGEKFNILTSEDGSKYLNSQGPAIP